MNMPVIAMLWLAAVGHGWVMPAVLSGPICRACPFLPRRLLIARLS